MIIVVGIGLGQFVFGEDRGASRASAPARKVTSPRPLRLDEVKAQAATDLAAIERCHERGITRAVVELAIEADGSVGDVRVTGHDFDAFERCLADRIGTWQFRATGAAVTVKLPLVFR